MNEILEMNETFILKGFSESETKCLNDFVKRIIHNIGEIPEIIPEDDETKR